MQLMTLDAYSTNLTELMSRSPDAYFGAAERQEQVETVHKEQE